MPGISTGRFTELTEDFKPPVMSINRVESENRHPFSGKHEINDI